jgi:predicted Zn-dependent peptidase
VPYGDIWHHVLPLIYRDHPYQWPVIGRDEKEIGDISLDDIIRFHKHYYMAGNAILSVAGNIDLDKTEQLIHQYFGDLPGGKQEVETYLFDLNGYQPTRLQLRSTVPVEAFYMIFPMPERNSTAFYALDLFSDLLVDGRSSILYQSMIKETQLLSTVDAYITGTLDSGLFVIEGRLSDGADIKQVELQIGQILEQQITAQITASTMEKLKNNVEAAIVFAEAGTLNKAMNLSFFELIGDAALINDEAKLYQQITEGEMRMVARDFLTPKLASLFHYVPDA